VTPRVTNADSQSHAHSSIAGRATGLATGDDSDSDDDTWQRRSAVPLTGVAEISPENRLNSGSYAQARGNVRPSVGGEKPVIAVSQRRRPSGLYSGPGASAEMSSLSGNPFLQGYTSVNPVGVTISTNSTTGNNGSSSETGIPTSLSHPNNTVASTSPLPSLRGPEAAHGDMSHNGSSVNMNGNSMNSRVRVRPQYHTYNPRTSTGLNSANLSTGSGVGGAARSSGAPMTATGARDDSSIGGNGALDVLDEKDLKFLRNMRISNPTSGSSSYSYGTTQNKSSAADDGMGSFLRSLMGNDQSSGTRG